MTTIVGDSVADDEVFSAKYAVVGINLLENFLCDGDVRRLVFHNNTGGASVFVVKNAVAAS